MLKVVPRPIKSLFSKFNFFPFFTPTELTHFTKIMTVVIVLEFWMASSCKLPCFALLKWSYFTFYLFALSKMKDMKYPCFIGYILLIQPLVFGIIPWRLKGQFIPEWWSTFPLFIQENDRGRYQNIKENKKLGFHFKTQLQNFGVYTMLSIKNVFKHSHGVELQLIS